MIAILYKYFDPIPYRRRFDCKWVIRRKYRIVKKGEQVQNNFFINMKILKYYIYSVVTLIFVAGINFVYFHSNRDIEVHTNNDALINNDSLIVYKDKYNRTIYDKSLLVDLETIKSLHNREIDDLNKRINGLNNLVRMVSIKNVIKYDTITVLKDTIVYRNNDTIKTKHFEFIDKWSFINGVLYRDL